jgi:hypothetical protein
MPVEVGDQHGGDATGEGDCPSIPVHVPLLDGCELQTTDEVPHSAAGRLALIRGASSTASPGWGCASCSAA